MSPIDCEICQFYPSTFEATGLCWHDPGTYELCAALAEASGTTANDTFGIPPWAMWVEEAKAIMRDLGWQSKWTIRFLSAEDLGPNLLYAFLVNDALYVVVDVPDSDGLRLIARNVSTSSAVG